jgi:hypothetical protein
MTVPPRPPQQTLALRLGGTSPHVLDQILSSDSGIYNFSLDNPD